MDNYYKKRLVPLLLPALILFLMVVAIPFFIGVIYSFTRWRGSYFAGGEHFWEAFCGLENYINIFRNKRFTSSLGYSVAFTITAAIVINVVSLAMALLATAIHRGGSAYRTVYFVPNLLGGLALGYIWQFIFEIVFSQILFGKDSFLSIPFLQNMLQDRWKAMVAIVIVYTWQMAGYMMLIYTNGLNGIPTDLTEAASIDGANVFQRFRHITVPMLMPSFTIVFFLTLSKSFMLLDQNVALTDGKFNTRLLAMQILRTTQDTNPPDYGMAQAQAVIFFILVATITLVQVKITSSKEVEI